MKKHPNLLKDYKPVQANKVLVSDITYVESAEGVHYFHWLQMLIPNRLKAINYRKI